MNEVEIINLLNNLRLPDNIIRGNAEKELDNVLLVRL